MGLSLARARHTPRRALPQNEGLVRSDALFPRMSDSLHRFLFEQAGVRGERSQGIVPLEGSSLAAALETYFSASEQLDTRLWLTADAQRAAGLLQRLPAERGLDEDWERIALLAQTVSTGELLDLPAERLLYRLFHEETVRLFESEPVAFRCSCSRQRIEDTLRALGAEEVESILEDEGAIEVDCEFCNRHYHLDRVDALKLFAPSVPHAAPPTQH